LRLTSPLRDDQGVTEASWPTHFPIDVTYYYELAGLRFSVRYYDAAMGNLCHTRFSAIKVEHVSLVAAALEIHREDGVWTVKRDARELTRTEDPYEARADLHNAVISILHPNLNIMAMIHAGVVAGPNGAILLPAAPHGGKSTLAAALTYSGYKLLSDDTAILDGPTETIHPFPIGLSLRSGSWPVLTDMIPELSRTPELVSGSEVLKIVAPPCSRIALAPLPVSTVIFPSYGADRREALGELSPGQALVKLSDAGLWVPHRDENVPQFLKWLENLPCYQLEYSNLEAALDLVRDAL
jgi:hypothetical protein